MLKKAKQAFLGAARHTGMFSLFLMSRWRSNRLLILGYHGVSIDDEHLWHPDLYLSKEEFQGRMQSLKDMGAIVLPLGKALSLLRTNSLPKKAVVITVDDGLHDFYACAYPILQEFNFPATVYQTTYYCSKAMPVFDLVCSYLLWKGRSAQIDGKDFTGEPGILDLATHEKRHEIAGKIRKRAVDQGTSCIEKENLARQLADRLGVDYDALLQKRMLHLMTASEILDISSKGIDVQLHTHRHRTPLEEALFTREITDNRIALKSLGVPNADHFCYPSGIYNREFLPWLRELDVVSATTCEHGFASAKSDSLLLPRLMDTGKLSRIEFEGWISGISAFLPARKARKEANLY